MGQWSVSVLHSCESWVNHTAVVDWNIGESPNFSSTCPCLQRCLRAAAILFLILTAGLHRVMWYLLLASMICFIFWMYFSLFKATMDVICLLVGWRYFCLCKGHKGCCSVGGKVRFGGLTVVGLHRPPDSEYSLSVSQVYMLELPCLLMLFQLKLCDLLRASCAVHHWHSCRALPDCDSQTWV